MPTDVIMPMLGMNQDTGKVLKWLRAEGDAVAKGDPLLEVETDKVTVEIEAPAAGTLSGISASEGEDVPVGRAIAVVLAQGEAPSANDAAAAAPAAAGAAAVSTAAPAAVSTAAPAAARSSRRQHASPMARQLAGGVGVRVGSIEVTLPSVAAVASTAEA